MLLPKHHQFARQLFRLCQDLMSMVVSVVTYLRPKLKPWVSEGLFSLTKKGEKFDQKTSAVQKKKLTRSRPGPERTHSKVDCKGPEGSVT